MWILLRSQATRDIKRIRFGFWFCSVQNFKEVRRLSSHARMNVGFRAFNVVVKVVSKQMNQVNRVISNFGVGMSREEDKRDVSNIFSG